MLPFLSLPVIYPSDSGILICPNLSLDTDLLMAPGTMSLRPFLILLDVPIILNAIDQAHLETSGPWLVLLS